eukprot:scaffold80610_cov28-Tisochrysis_lutea.AAC.2
MVRSTAVGPEHYGVWSIPVEGVRGEAVACGEQLEVRTAAFKAFLEEELELDDEAGALGSDWLGKDGADAVLARSTG